MTTEGLFLFRRHLDKIWKVIMHPAQLSEARLGGVHFIFGHIQICTRLLQGELFKVTKYTAHISTNGLCTEHIR